MKVHTTAFKEQIKEMGRELDSIITYGDTVLGNEQLNAVTPSFQGSLLKSVMKQLDIDSNVEIPVGTILNYKFGVKVNGEYEYLDFGNYVVKDVEKQEDTMSYKITCYDKLLFSMKDYAKMPITYPITIRSYINALCSFLGITFANNNDTFVNYDKTIPMELYLDANGNSIGYTFRDVLDELAQVTASTIYINDNDEVEIRYITDTGDTIDEEFLKNVNVNFGEKYGKINSIVLSRSGESDSVYLDDPQSVAINGRCELKIIDNQIMNFNNRDEFLPEILGKLNGLEYYLNDFASTGIAYYDLCDRYNVKVGDNTYSCVMFNDELLVTQGLEENTFTEMPQETETDYTKADKTDRKINQTYLIVDKQNQQIEAVISQTDEQNQKIAKVTQTVDELNSKISDIADITISGEDTDAQVELDNINESEPIRLVIRPIGENISYDYPHEDFPQEDFSKIRTIRFTNTKTEEVFDYILPMDLLYYDSEHYDEFILDYEGQSCMVNKRVGYNADGTTYVLDSEYIVECEEYPQILLTEGDYKVQVLGYDTAYIFVRLMTQNIYTTQFYTKAETDSIISQTSQSIDLSVNKKLSNYSTTTEMNSAIQLSASNITSSVSENYATKNTTNALSSRINQTAKSIELSTTDNETSAGITIKLKNEDGTEIDSKDANITMSGLVKFTDLSGSGSTTINGSNIKTGTISTDRLESKVITTDNFSAQSINADNITSGSLSADKVSGGTISSSSLNIGGNAYYLRMGAGWTKNPEVSGLNVGNKGVNVNGLGFNSDGSRFTFASGVNTPNMTVSNILSTNHIQANNSVTIHAGGNDNSYANNGGIYMASGQLSGTPSHITLNAQSGNGYVYAEGNGTSRGRVAIDSAGPSSRCLKENITNYDNEEFNDALKLLKDIDIYNYNYKYNIHSKDNQYGFIIDDLLDNELARKFLHFKDETAGIMKDGRLDYSANEEENFDNLPIIHFKRYDEETLIKYLLVCCKSLQNKTETLENKIIELESEK